MRDFGHLSVRDFVQFIYDADGPFGYIMTSLRFVCRDLDTWKAFSPVMNRRNSEEILGDYK